MWKRKEKGVRRHSNLFGLNAVGRVAASNTGGRQFESMEQKFGENCQLNDPISKRRI